MFDRDDRLSWVAIGVVLMMISIVTPAVADTDMDLVLSTASESAAQAGGGGGAGAASKLAVHGFLTQAYADASFNEVPVGVLPDGSVGPLGVSPDLFEAARGIPEDGTTNYRFLALQFRYDISDSDVVVVQLSSRALGDSEVQDFEEEVELDWAFYERRLGDNTSLKVGRVQIPFGIYNELRDVGPILPFYRPAIFFYKEGSFTSETVDGLSIAHTFFAESDWTLDLTGYYGEWEAVQVAPSLNLSGIVRAKDGLGFQAWLTSPWGVRFGLGSLAFDQEGGGFLRPADRRQIVHASLDATFGRFTLQVEWNEEDAATLDQIVGVEPEVGFEEWYAMVGYSVTDKFSIWALSETAKITSDSLLALAPASRDQGEDTGIAFNYAFSPNLVLKAEHHWTKFRGANDYFDFSTGDFRLRNEVYEADDGSYTIIALSVSF